ncbi:type I polyketide synthase [Chroococcidiopsis sp. TS-821]|uniref:type I polyketide synthase n=1 Tax=Chroococcidiopsis sp. TS-821 TaxID=1378066 RepID=UPI000CEE8035|nr:type I polyketide synthase [Chroococcidiopsis sp. TS-821]PPS41251.1 beta-ketoacyl synthase [Chroococcidiopsis sp. TS-821]
MSNQNGLEIAVIGLSGRFPGSKNIEEFWNNLAAGIELISTFTDDTQPANAIAKVGGVLSDVDQFDAAFFGFNPREAEAMDPQHRLFLECAWEALENAGYSTDADKSIGVFAGVGMGTYLLYNLSPNQEFMASRGFLQTLVGVDKDYLPTRVSYKLNLTGPSISVGTACSSSLVAVHLACQSLLSGECDMALAAGVAVKVPQNELTLSPDEIASPDGHCRAFDCRANGTVGGNGVGVVVLKRLEDAIADRDCIYAVIKGSAINNDGALKVGYTAPSEAGQTRAIRTAQMIAEVEPETISYMETHGTGTTLGDPIEIAAMTQAFRESTNQKQFCAIGSVKTNIGHLDAAAGIAGLIKTILALYHQQIPPSLNFETPNPQINFAESPFYVNTQLREWKSNGNPRRAGVSSFGFGGTNAHVVLEEAPVLPKQTTQGYQLLTLSAKTATALTQATLNLRDRLRQSPEINLADVAYTLQIGRRSFDYRRMVVAQTVEEAIQALDDPQRIVTGYTQASDRAVIFMFPGQGSQYVNMARELYNSEPLFQAECDRQFAILAQHNIDLRQVIYPTTAEAQTTQLGQTAFTQPALFVIEYALAKLWMSWGVQPRAMIGHSIGEYVAACLAGVFSLEDALKLVAVRGQLMQQQPPGAMLAVHLSALDVQPFLHASLSLAASNSPHLCVVSGTIEAIQNLKRELTAKKIESRLLHTSHAFHSAMMESVVTPFLKQFESIRLNPPQIPFISNVTGTWIAATAANPQYWAQHLRQTVQFSQGIAELLNLPDPIFLEVGPGSTLSTLTKQQAAQSVFASLPHPKAQSGDCATRSTGGDREFLLQTVGKLWLEGVAIDWASFYARQQRHRVPLPTYPFERQRYWIEPPQASSSSAVATRKTDIADWFYIPSWKRSPIPQIINNKQKQCWLIFADRNNVATAIAQRLQQQEHQVILVYAGESYSHHDNVYTLHPGDREHYQTLIQEVLARDEAPIIAHLWTLAELSFDESQTLGFYSLLYLAQALGQHQSPTIPIHVVSSNIQEVIGTEEIHPAKATVLGACQVIAQEYVNLTCRHIDVLPSPDINQMIAEMRSPATEPQVAYRGNYRWIPTYEPLRLETVEPALRTQGVYLITGGLGEIGLAVAEYLAHTVQAKLVLVSRSPLPPRQEWERWCKDAQDPISVKLQKIQALEAIGAEVLVLSADVADATEMQAVMTRVEQTFGQIHGIFHTAGVAGDGIVQLKTAETAANVMRPKVQGTLVLSQYQPLDFLVLFSSLSAIQGGVGQVDYCAANCFLDAFARSRAQQRVISINWDMWQIGMGAQKIAELPDALKQERLAALKTGIAPQEGIEALHRILQSRCNQVIVSPKDWQTNPKQERIAVDTSVNTVDTPSNHARSLPTTYIAPSNEIEQQIAALWQEQLGIERVGVNDNFFELGGHSLLAVRIVSRLRELYSVDLSLRVLLSEAPTVAGLASAIAAQLQPDDSDEMTRLLAEIENLSLDEVQAQLASQQNL